jgi:hypothetical protein
LRAAHGFSPGDSTVDFGVRLRPQKFRVGRDFWYLHPLGAHVRRGGPAVCSASSAKATLTLRLAGSKGFTTQLGTTWRDHIQQKPEWRALLAEAEKVRDEVWRDHALEMVKSAMPRNWQAAMCYLERGYPLEFSLRIPPSRAPNSTEAPIGDQVPEERLLEYGRQMAEFARANEQKGAAESADGNRILVRFLVDSHDASHNKN